MKRDYYEVLGVQKTADEKKLKSAYRKLAKKYHPDANPGDKNAEQRFKEVGEAYAVLSDPEKRKLYDTYGFAAFEGPDPSQQHGGGSSGFHYTGTDGGFQSFHFDGQDAEDLFESMFGGMFGGGGRTRGFRRSAGGSAFGDGIHFSDFGGFGQREQADIRTELTISFMEAALGCTKQIRLDTPGEAGSRALQIRIPAGIDEGKTMRLRGKGRAKQAGGAGDLLIVIHIAPDGRYTRKGLDVYTSAEIPFTTAALGGEAMLPTIHGNVKCRIPAGIQSGKQIRLRQKGIQAEGLAGTGDAYVEIRIEVPKDLSAEERRVLRKFAELRAGR